ncbi:hypothetical protein LL033_17265 [Clostridium estertheticum]|uniref:hypothetical protein n=1 Tax=Clostridium estertheticum TaxID=238834 RepID=UPI001C0D914D|nr:hypothetical protein [Clostridium estertheticum]MBU3216681.1 hypothetical protein [Clostridium estertheticum]WAG54363.1 hypothetical protein LL033_17265 [Clostridium estertheticum]
MSTKMFSWSFAKKIKKYKNDSLKLKSLGESIEKEFFITVSKEHINNLKEIIDVCGNEKHKTSYCEFCLNFIKGEVSNDDIGLYQFMYEIYGDRLCEKQLKNQFNLEE